MNKDKPKQKIVLKRERHNVIQQNLEHMEHHLLKKKIAQQKYYESKTGVSPMKKRYVPQQSVHDRLGAAAANAKSPLVPIASKKIIARPKRIVPNANGTITRRYRQFTNSNITKMKAQNRLNLIKQGITNQSVNGSPNKGKIVLRRNRASNINKLNNSSSKPVNYLIQLKNNVETGQPKYKRHSMQGALNAKLQQEIKIVQSQCNQNCVVPNMPIALRDFGFTKLSLHTRFSNY